MRLEFDFAAQMVHLMCGDACVQVITFAQFADEIA